MDSDSRLRRSDTNSRLLCAAILAFVGMLAIAPRFATAVSIAEDQQGQVLLFPYIAVDGSY